MKCDQCDSERIISFDGKCSDGNMVTYQGIDSVGYYVPYDLNIGGGDYIRGDMCADCGKMQGDFPLSADVLSVFVIEEEADG